MFLKLTSNIIAVRFVLKSNQLTNLKQHNKEQSKENLTCLYIPYEKCSAWTFTLDAFFDNGIVHNIVSFSAYGSSRTRTSTIIIAIRWFV